MSSLLALHPTAWSHSLAMATTLSSFGTRTIPRSDVVLGAGLSVAKALCTRAKVQRDSETADFTAIDAAIRDIEKQIAGLDEITRLTGTIQSNSEKVLKRASLMRTSLEQQVRVLDDRVRDLEALFGGGEQ